MGRSLSNRPTGGHTISKEVIADPFMGGGTTIYEANRLGFNVVGTDINPMAFWVVKQSLAPLDLDAFSEAARAVIADVEKRVGKFYVTRCDTCGKPAPVKYFIWVKTQSCPHCQAENDLFPGSSPCGGCSSSAPRRGVPGVRAA